MSVNNKVNNITLEDLLEAGKNMGVKRSKCLKSIEEVKTSIANFEKYAREVGIKQEINEASAKNNT